MDGLSETRVVSIANYSPTTSSIRGTYFVASSSNIFMTQ